MKDKPPPEAQYVQRWWRRALDDGRHCENKRRERYYTEYYEAAEADLTAAGLIPDELQGTFWLLYRRGFRYGYDNARLQRERDLPRAKWHGKLGKKRSSSAWKSKGKSSL